MLLGGGAASSSGCQTDCGLEGVVDIPLETSEGTDHDDPGHETSPEALETNLTVDLAHLLSESAGRVTLGDQLGEDGIGGVGHHCAEDTGKVAGSEGNAQLSGLAVVLLALGEDVIIEISDEPFEGDELHNCVGDLSAP